MRRGRSNEKGQTRKLLDKFLSTNEDLNQGRIIEQVSGGLSTCAPLERTSVAGFMLAGDAARMTDPITGGGINRACIQGRYAGEVAAEAFEADDVSTSFLTKYENCWRERFEETLFRNWMIKEKIATLTDSQFNRIVSAISDYDWEKVSVGRILKGLREKLPESEEELGGFLGF